jgi:hypothetical protein
MRRLSIFVVSVMTFLALAAPALADIAFMP